MKITKKIKTEADELYRLCLVNGVIDEGRVRNVVQCLITTDQRKGPAILQHFWRLVKNDRVRHTAIIESAVPLMTEVQETLRESLLRQYGPGLEMTFSHKPSLIGGLRVQVGCDVYDGSVRARLEALEKSF